MNILTNKKIVSDFYEVIINQMKIERLGDFLTDDFIHNDVKRGVDGQARAIQMFYDAFSNLNNTILLSLCENDLVSVHERWTGDHTGDFLGVPASNKKVSWTSTAILKIRGNKICQAWDENDFLGLFTQIGKFPQ